MGLREGAILKFGPPMRDLYFKRIELPDGVYELAERNGYLAGRLSDGLVYVTADQAVHYKSFSADTIVMPDTIREGVGFAAESIGFLPTGDVWIGGTNAIAVYDQLPDILMPEVYIPEDCTVDLGDELIEYSPTPIEVDLP